MTPALKRVLFSPRAQSGSGATPASFVAATAGIRTSSASGTGALPTAIANDIVILIVGEEGGGGSTAISSPGNSGAAWNLLDRVPSAGKTASTWWRQLNAADISNGNFSWTFADTSGAILAASYRGATTVTLKTTAGTIGGTSTSLVIPGFAPNAASKGVLFTCYEGADVQPPGSLTTSPQSFNLRAAVHPWFPDLYILDLLTGYTNSNTTISGFAGGSSNTATALEFT